MAWYLDFLVYIVRDESVINTKELVAAQPNLTIDRMTAELGLVHGLKVSPVSVGRLLHRLGLSQKNLQVLEQTRKDVVIRRVWIGKRQPLMANHLQRLAFIDDTLVKTNMTKTIGWLPRGRRLVDHAPLVHRCPQTFIGALRQYWLDAPSFISGAPLMPVNMHRQAVHEK